MLFFFIKIAICSVYHLNIIIQINFNYDSTIFPYTAFAKLYSNKAIDMIYRPCPAKSRRDAIYPASLYIDFMFKVLFIIRSSDVGMLSKRILSFISWNNGKL